MPEKVFLSPLHSHLRVRKLQGTGRSISHCPSRPHFCPLLSHCPFAGSCRGTDSIRKKTRPRQSSRKTWALPGLCLASQHLCLVLPLPQRGLAQEVPSEYWRTGRGKAQLVRTVSLPTHPDGERLGMGSASVCMCEPHPQECCPLAPLHSPSLLPWLKESKGPSPEPREKSQIIPFSSGAGDERF